MTIEKSLKIMVRGTEIDDKVKKYVQKKVESIYRMLNKVSRTEVEINKDKKGKFRAEIMIKTPYQLYRSENISESIEGSVDMSEDDLKDQIRKDKDKTRTLKMRGKRSIKKRAVLDKSARFRK